MAYTDLCWRYFSRSRKADVSYSQRHICGSECLTIAEIAYRVADFLKLDRSLIEPVTTEEMKEVTPRPRFSGLSIEKAKAEIGYTPRTLEEGMEASLF